MYLTMLFMIVKSFESAVLIVFAEEMSFLTKLFSRVEVASA